MVVKVCIGSSCHLKGSQEIVEKLQEAIAINSLEDEVTLTGSFCIGKCNRLGVTVSVDDEIYTGITPESFADFFKEHIIGVIRKGV